MSRTMRAPPERACAAAKRQQEPSVAGVVARRWTRDLSKLVLIALVVLLAVPLVVALVGLRQPKWYPIWDLGLTEMQLRDVGSMHTPLTGFVGRLGVGNERGSHPGPLGFYMMFPSYRLFGASAWSMQIAAVSVHVAAIGAIIWLCWRRRSLGLLLATVAVLAFLIRGLGPEAMTQPWNPYLPMLWWVVFLLAVWLVACSDVPVLPVAAFAGSFCLQNHASYVVLVASLTLLAVASVWVPVYRRRGDRQGVRRATKWSLIAVAVGVAVWIPPVVDQLIGEGNLGVLWRHFRHWNEQPIGLGRAFDVVLLHLDPWRLLSDGIFSGNNFFFAIQGSKLPGVLLLSVWGVTAVIAIRLGHAALVRLHALLAVVLVLAVVAISRVGYAFWYLLLWLWGVHALLLLAVGWTLGVLLVRNLDDTTRRKVTKWAGVAVAGAAVAFTFVFALEAVDVSYDRRYSTVLDALVPQTVSALESEQERSYLIQWHHGPTGAVGRGLMNELDRRGFDIGADALYREEVRPHRVKVPGEADAVIAVVGGRDIETWRARPGVQQIAYVDLAATPQAELREGRGAAVFIVRSPRS
jgi:hypothetical protein